METDLIFNHGIDLPGFASHPLLEAEAGVDTLRGYYRKLISMAQEMGVGVILDTVTWVANKDRGAAIGYSSDKLKELNVAAVELISEVGNEYGDVPTILCGQMGPRGDGYAPENLMSADEAELYHSEQMEVLARTDLDMVAGFTLCYPEEAIGIIRAGQRFNMPVAIAFTVETDGCLPTGIPLREAIQAVDAATGAGAIHFLVNCAHSDHISEGLANELGSNVFRVSFAMLLDAAMLSWMKQLNLTMAILKSLKNYPLICVNGFRISRYLVGVAVLTCAI